MHVALFFLSLTNLSYDIMRNTYLILCLLSLNVFGQTYNFQIELVDPNVGAQEYLTFEPNYQATSNDDGLNQIFLNNNVTYYETVYGFLNDELIGKMGLLSCVNCDPNIFVQDLLSYNTVVQFAVQTDNNTELPYFYNSLRLNLNSATNGSFSSLTNGVVVTNNSSLSQIFIDYNVRYYAETFPSTYYELVCDCDAELLKQELDNLPSVVQFTEFVTYVFLLSTDDAQLVKAEVYPNPFKNVVKLKTSVPLSAILLYDVLGKQVVSANNVSTFEANAVNLKTGVYILRVTDINGNSITKKLVKQ